ncbi:MAG: hypothetical protein C5B46_03220 [Proteobacteria bacterium]|nr:MAG: hypothetical protein C5B46_03220 [Pseudomonadota bacterium]
MEKLSEMMDGELNEQEARAEIRRATQDPALKQQWETYHLIRDVLRNDIVAGGTRLSARVAAQLQNEPTIMAPHTRFPARLVRYSLPMAAAVAGIAVVGWLALSMGPTSHPDATRAAQQGTVAPVAQAKEREYYLLAHREFSPASAMQGVASYVRTVATGDADMGQ